MIKIINKEILNENKHKRTEDVRFRCATCMVTHPIAKVFVHNINLCTSLFT